MRLAWLVFGLIATLGSAACTPAGAPRGAAVLSHMPPTLGTAMRLGRAPAAMSLDLRIALPYRNAAELDDFLEAVSDPQSPAFHHYLTPEAFRARYHPSSDQVAAVVSALQARNVAAEPQADGILVHATARVADVEALFQTQIQRFRSAEGVEMFAPASELQVPADLPIAGVIGLHSGPAPSRQRLQPRAVTSLASTSTLTPADVHSIYGIPTNLDGQGQTLGLIEFDSYDANDVVKFAKTYGLAATPLRNIRIDGYSGALGSVNYVTEVTSDIEMMVGLAPHADQIAVIETRGGWYPGIIDMLNRTANPVAGDNFIRSLSISWGFGERYCSATDLDTESNVLKQMAAQGQTLFVASGDSGATADDKVVSGSDPAVISDPAGQPYALVVGGTILTQSNGTYTRETTWNDIATGNGAGGGGVSAHFAIPSYQQNLALGATLGSNTMRNAPDVSLSASLHTPYAVVVQGALEPIAGTSLAAPLWAAYAVLVEQARAAKGLPPVGFFTPALYQLGQSPLYKTVFHDIADNSTNGYYPAVEGYDNATGWGSMQGTAMLQALSSGMARRAALAPAQMRPGP